MHGQTPPLSAVTKDMGTGTHLANYTAIGMEHGNNIHSLANHTVKSDSPGAGNGRTGGQGANTNSVPTAIPQPNKALPQVSNAPDVNPLDRSNVGPINVLHRLVDLTNEDILQKGTDAQKALYSLVKWLYAPDRQDFKDDPKMAAYRDPQDSPNTIYVGRMIASYADTEHGYNYAGATFNRGGDSALLFVGLHEFGHVSLATSGGDLKVSADREIDANRFLISVDPQPRKLLA